VSASLIKPAWIGRFEVSGPRDHRELAGFAAAFVWVAAQAEGGDDLRARVSAALTVNGLTVVRGENVQSIADDAAQPHELQKLLREARRQPGAVIVGKLHPFEDNASRRPMLLELKTERLVLRAWRQADREPFAAMCADRDVMAFAHAPLTRRQADDAVDGYLAAFHNTGFSFLVAEDRATHAFAGTMGLRLMHDVLPSLQQPAVELGVRLARAHQGKGLGSEGARALLKLAFNDFQLDEVAAVCAVANTPARNMLHAVGFEHRTALDFDHPRFPPRHLYARHAVYVARSPHTPSTN
jgi:RimJ/RimL family protein N-acetyltransferase